MQPLNYTIHYVGLFLVLGDRIDQEHNLRMKLHSVRKRKLSIWSTTKYATANNRIFY